MSEVVYHGVGGTDAAKPAMVLLETSDGEVLGPLRHVVRHSPTGFAWGYSGSGPADLARSILIDALGEAAACPVCRGTRNLIYPGGQDEDEPGYADPVPYDEEDPAHRAAAEVSEGPLLCWECEDGYLPYLPYQDYKFDVIARLDGREWRIPRADVLAWLAEHGVAA